MFQCQRRSNSHGAGGTEAATLDRGSTDGKPQLHLLGKNARNITVLYDIALEPDDVIELGSGRYSIQSIRRTLRRGTPPVDTITAFEVTAGVRP